MSARAAAGPGAEAASGRGGGFPAWHLALVLTVSAAWESLFVRHGLSRLDEGWPLYAAMRLHAGGTLYDDVMWVFPPGHLLPAWIGYGLDPPGLVATRILYAAFVVALCGAIYVLGTRLTRPPFALLGALLLAVAAPRTHHMHIVFGYRYLVFAVLALLAFERRLSTGRIAWLGVAGALAGVQLVFRGTPALAVSCGVAAGIVAAGFDPRRWLRDGAVFAAGLLLVAGPVVAWFAGSVGLDALWREVVVRPATMLFLQSVEVPELAWPRASRLSITASFIALEFRVYTLLLAGYLVALVAAWIRSARSGRPFAHPLLLAAAVFAAVFFGRSQLRADEVHLDSALPPILLLVGHTAGLVFARVERRLAPARRGPARIAAGLAVLSLWIFLLRVDFFLSSERLGVHPLESVGGRIRVSSENAARIDTYVRQIRRRTGPDDVVLDLSWAPILHPLSGRLGPGYKDVVMPGTFLDPAEEEAFVARLRERPPAVVFRANWPFDLRTEGALRRIAPRLADFVAERYTAVARDRRHALLVPRGRGGPGPAAFDAEPDGPPERDPEPRRPAGPAPGEGG